MIDVAGKILGSLVGVVLPAWVKWVSLLVAFLAVGGFGFVKGIERTNDRIVLQDLKIVRVQGEVTEKTIIKYIERKTEQKKIDEEIKHEGQSYAIKYSDDWYTFNNEYVWLHDNSVTGTISPLPSGELGDSSGIKVAEQLEVAIHNNTVARQWKDRALTCETWAKEQEEANQ